MRALFFLLLASFAFGAEPVRRTPCIDVPGLNNVDDERLTATHCGANFWGGISEIKPAPSLDTTAMVAGQKLWDVYYDSPTVVTKQQLVAMKFSYFTSLNGRDEFSFMLQTPRKGRCGDLTFFAIVKKKAELANARTYAIPESHAIEISVSEDKVQVFLHEKINLTYRYIHQTENTANVTCGATIPMGLYTFTRNADLEKKWYSKDGEVLDYRTPAYRARY